MVVSIPRTHASAFYMLPSHAFPGFRISFGSRTLFNPRSSLTPMGPRSSRRKRTFFTPIPWDDSAVPPSSSALLMRAYLHLMFRRLSSELEPLVPWAIEMNPWRGPRWAAPSIDTLCSEQILSESRYHLRAERQSRNDGVAAPI